MKISSLTVTSLFLTQWACGEPPRIDPSEIAIPETGTVTSESGLIKKVSHCPAGADLIPDTQRCTVGDGTLAMPSDKAKVEVHYVGWTTDGGEIDSSRRRGKPANFGLNQVIPGWNEGLQTMVVGEESRLWIPEEMAYKGEYGKPAGMLVFDVELLSFEEE